MRRALTLAGIAVLCLIGAEVRAHYCSNIFSGPARFVVKPETTTLAVTGSTTLRVYLQNNFPYTLFSVQLRGQATGFTITSAPASRTIHPGQNVSYVLTITGTGTANMTMQMQFRLSGWRGPTDTLVKQNPAQSTLVSGAVYGSGTAQQSPSLNLGKLADLYGSATLGAGQPTFGRTGMQQLIKMFGYRYCWDEGGTWASGSQDCPSPSAEQTWGSPTSTDTFPQDCMRAGVEVAVRKALLGGDLAAAQNAAANALKGSGSSDHKCLAAVVGGYLWQGASDASPFTSALSLAGNSVPAVCQTAGLRALGTNNTPQTCPATPWQQAAACAAGEGIRNNDGPVTSILMPNSGDGSSSASSEYQKSLFYAYMLYLTQGVRKASGGVVPFYPDAGTSGPTPDQNPTVDQPKPTVDQPKPTVDIPKKDQAIPKKDQAIPKKDQAIPKKDQAIPKKDTATPPGLEPQPPKLDTGPLTETGVGNEGGLPGQEAGPKTEAGNNSNGGKLEGGCGCAVAERSAGAPLLLVVAFAIVLLTIRRRRKPR